jgi:hypothetical protein
MECIQNYSLILCLGASLLPPFLFPLGGSLTDRFFLHGQSSKLCASSNPRGKGCFSRRSNKSLGWGSVNLGWFLCLFPKPITVVRLEVCVGACTWTEVGILLVPKDSGGSVTGRKGAKQQMSTSWKTIVCIVLNAWGNLYCPLHITLSRNVRT